MLVHLKNLILAGVNLMDGHIASAPATNFMLVVGICRGPTLIRFLGLSRREHYVANCEYGRDPSFELLSQSLRFTAP